MQVLCPLCGEPLKIDGSVRYCNIGCTAYIDTEELSMDEFLDIAIGDVMEDLSSYLLGSSDKDEEIPF